MPGKTTKPSTNTLNVRVAIWSMTIVMAYFGPGNYAAELIEGMDPAMLLIWPTAVFVVLLITSLILTFLWARGLEANAVQKGKELPSSRRRFLIGGAAMTGGIAGAAAAGLSRMSGWMTVTGPALGAEVVTTDPNPRKEWQDARVSSYRPLGSTGFNVSDICVGSGQLTRHPDPSNFLRDALDRGVNYIDTSPDYAGTKSEQAIGTAIQGRKRDDIFLATKWCTSDGHVRQGSDVADYIKAIEDSLKRLNTDYVDLVHVHSCDSVERLLDPNVHEAFDRMKEQGKVRFMGVSTHTPNLEQVAKAAIDSDRFDVMMLAYHHGAWPLQTTLIDEAHAKGMGVVAMKTLKGAKHKGLADFRPEADSYAQAAFKWVLSNPAVACLVISFFENQQIDEYLYASGQQLNTNDLAVLEKYDQLIAGTHCFAHCGDCLGACPENLAINDILRYRMYFEDYGDQKQAMQLYSKLENKASACLTCPAPCNGSCPSGINIKDRMLGASEQLILA